MVVDGWMPSFFVEDAARLYNSQVLLARPLTRGASAYETGEFTASYIHNALVDLGVPADQINIVFFAPGRRDRTFAGALAIRDRLLNHGFKTKVLDVVTLGAHARRSRLLYEKAFASDWQIGVTALNDESYDGEHWWRSSSGIREVPFEFVAYLNAMFLFSPESNPENGRWQNRN